MNTLTRQIAAACASHLLAEKWLIAPSLRVGHQWIESVVRAGQPVINLHVKTLKSIAVELAAPFLADQELAVVTRPHAVLLMDQVFRRLQPRLAYLSPLKPSHGLAEVLLRAVDALRMGGLDVETLPPEPFEVAAKGHDLRVLATEYARRLAEEKLLDYADVLGIATEQLRARDKHLRKTTLLLIPADQRFGVLERRLLESIRASQQIELMVDEPIVEGMAAEAAATDLDRLRWYITPEQAPPPREDDTCRIVRAAGEVNEVRHLLRQCVAEEIAWDQVELLHTDTATYIPLIYESLAAIEEMRSSDTEDLPVTFAEGIPASYSRPGRALALWVQWLESNFASVYLERMIQEGLVQLPVNNKVFPSYSRVANTLRSLRIGASSERYARKIEARTTALLAQRSNLESDVPDETKREWRRNGIERELQCLTLLHQLTRDLLDGCAKTAGSGSQVVAAAADFVERLARSTTKLDRYSSEKLVVDLRDMETWLREAGEESSLDVLDWLRSLPAATRVLGSGPRPGCLHVDNLGNGGHSGRLNTFIVGLDDSRFPGAGLQDPLLLDGERHRLSSEIPTAAFRLEERVQDFARLLARLRGRLTLSFSCQSVSDNREMFPSSAILSVYRVLSGQPAADQQDFLRSLAPPTSFAPAVPAEALDLSEWWLWRLSGPERIENLPEILQTRFPHLVEGARAREARRSEVFGEHDGWVPLAGLDHGARDDGGQVYSSNRLEVLGKCPRQFFFKYALEIKPPDEHTIEPNLWLDHMQMGVLLHTLFERFIVEVVAAGRTPSVEQDANRLEELLEELVEEHREEYPPHTESSFWRQRNELRRTAHNFLKEEERYWSETPNRPVHLEVTLGMKASESATPIDSLEPIALELPGGTSILVCGRIDRIDRVAAGDEYILWDYKTGSTFGFDAVDPFRQGRKIQAYLYMRMVEHRLRQTSTDQATVTQFGYFFPSDKGMGERLAWDREALEAGGSTISPLLQLVAAGAFPATNDKEDCKFCHYQAICGDVVEITKSSARKLENTANDVLTPLRSLRLGGQS